MSFGFSVVADEKSYGPNGERQRVRKEVRLYEVSPVAFPAYAQTEVTLHDWPGRDGEETGDVAEHAPAAVEDEASDGAQIAPQDAVAARQRRIRLVRV